MEDWVGYEAPVPSSTSCICVVAPVRSSFIPFAGRITSHCLCVPCSSSPFDAFWLLGCFFLLANTNNSAVCYGVGYFWGYLILWHFCSVSYRGRSASQGSKGALRRRGCSWQWEVPRGPLKCSFQSGDQCVCSQAPDPSMWRNWDLNLVLLASKAMLQLFYTELVLITALQWLGRWERYGWCLRWAVRTELSILREAHVKWWLSAIGNSVVR